MRLSKPQKTVLLSILAIAVLLGLWVFLVGLSKQETAKFVLAHFVALVGLPMASIASFVLVAFLKQRSGEGISFKGFGFEFQGPSGEIVLWILCFISIVISIKLTW